MAFDFPAPLLALESRAWEEIQAGQLTVATATAVHQGVAEYAEASGVARYEVEMGLKQAVRHADAAGS